MLPKPLVCATEFSVVSEPDDMAPGRKTNDDGVEMKFADKPFANDIP